MNRIMRSVYSYLLAFLIGGFNLTMKRGNKFNAAFHFIVKHIKGG